MSEHEPTCMFKANAANDPDECGGCEYARVQRWEKAQHRADCTWERGYLVCDCAELNAAVEAEREAAARLFGLTTMWTFDEAMNVLAAVAEIRGGTE